MNGSAKRELQSIKTELQSIINELEDISNGVANDFKGIGNDRCSSSINRVIEQYRWVKRQLNRID
jgi:hypothetical protein